MRRLALAAIVLSAACGDTAPPASFDGSVLVGDASSRDAARADALEDAAIEDATSAPDAAHDAGEPERDAAPADAELPDALVRADASLPDASSVCASAPVATLSATTAAARARALDGQVVDVVGTATVGPAACTRRLCPPENPCCNACTAQLTIDGALPLASGPCHARVGCAGDECSLVCSPPVLGVRETFRGTLRATPEPSLELHEVRP